MMTRRFALASGLAACACGLRAEADETSSRGCWLPPGVALPPSGPIQAFESPADPVLEGSGDPKLDFALAFTLADLTKVFGVLPGFGYYDDADHHNAKATGQKLLNRSDGTVLMGRNMLAELLSMPEAPDACVVSVCAHEYGHILQIKTGMMATLDNGQPTIKRKELHADFLAGYYAGTRKLKRDSFPAAVFATTQSAYGRNDFTNPQHHGTPAERGAATSKGFDVAFYQRKPIDEAAQIGLDYVFGV